MPTIFDYYTEDEVEDYVSEIEGMIRKGYSKEKIEEETYLEYFDELFSIAKARIRNDKTKERLYMNLEDLRFATHEEVANYRAERLKCNLIVDACCGVGLQSIAFSKTCKKVIAIEVDERKARYALENLKKLGLKNVEVIHGDAVKSAKNVSKADIVFCDTERAAEEEARSIEGLKPDINDVMKAYRKVTKDFCIEVPPQIRNVSLDCEKEYVSLNGKLNRLNLYFGGLKKADFSAVALPIKARVEGEQGKMPSSCKKVMAYLYEVDEAVVKAQLLSKIIPAGVFLYNFSKQVLLTSDKLVKSGFFINYKVVAKCKPDHNDIVRGLKKVGAGSIVLRARVKPEDYWGEKKKYESELEGDKKFHLFITEKDALIAELLV